MHSLGDEDYLGSDANTLRTYLAHIRVHAIVRRNRNSTLEVNGTERAVNKKKNMGGLNFRGRKRISVAVSFCKECG